MPGKEKLPATPGDIYYFFWKFMKTFLNADFYKMSEITQIEKSD
jgi:hypothetical protein